MSNCNFVIPPIPIPPIPAPPIDPALFMAVLAILKTIRDAKLALGFVCPKD